MPSAISVVTLLTDFGERDYFVASMKGVILNINSQARIVDLSHAVTPHSIEEAAFLLQSCYHYFPDGTVHVIVVDPGVGSSRRPLLVSTSRFFFVAPDNGVLTPIFDNELSVEVRQIENRQFRLDSEGATFDGRDLFAPAAAWLTRGQVPGTYGRLVRDYHRLSLPKPEVHEGVLKGRVAYIDHFGNVITDITASDLNTLQEVTKYAEISIEIGGMTVRGLKRHYGQGAKDSPAALLNSNGHVEIFLQEDRADRLLQVKVGDPVVIRPV
ncbi:MAG: hypothetical protein D6704_10630 [Nitrospirae bacterium]|nr:MAG: hypothetical protein D6704_10630 [Nitrospirota bacterium]